MKYECGYVPFDEWLTGQNLMPKMHGRMVWFLSVRCEVCGHIGTMTQLDYNARGGSKCPADQCTGHLLVVAEHERQVLTE